MRSSKQLGLAINILRHSKLRSYLTIIGIVIGVAAVVAIISIGDGLSQTVEESLGGLGAEIITITPGYSGATDIFGGGPPQPGGSQVTGGSDAKLTDKDIQALRSIEDIDYIQGSVSGRGSAYYLGENAGVSISGVDPKVWKDITTSDLALGRFLSTGDYNSVVVGTSVAEDMFKQPLGINRMIEIEGKSFKIVGILEPGSDDRTVIMPIDAARDILSDIETDEYHSITIKASDSELVDKVIEDVEKKLFLTRHVSERDRDFTVISMKAIQEQVNQIMGTMTAFLTAIAAVSLLVGAVGIANTMFTTVMEKTKEIGIMKSIGAKNRDILTIFILYAALVGLVGGLIGITLGAGMSLAIGGMSAGMAQGFTTVVTPQLLLMGLAIAVGIGTISGMIPARRASMLKPVDALRYE